MNKINRLFQDNTDRKLHSLYFCAGAPTVDLVPQVLLTLQRRGIDMVEVGIPFSDPLADGPVIQAAGTGPPAMSWREISVCFSASVLNLFRRMKSPSRITLLRPPICDQ